MLQALIVPSVIGFVGGVTSRIGEDVYNSVLTSKPKTIDTGAVRLTPNQPAVEATSKSIFRGLIAAISPATAAMLTTRPAPAIVSPPVKSAAQPSKQKLACECMSTQGIGEHDCDECVAAKQSALDTGAVSDELYKKATKRSQRLQNELEEALTKLKNAQAALAQTQANLAQQKKDCEASKGTLTAKAKMVQDAQSATAAKKAIEHAAQIEEAKGQLQNLKNQLDAAQNEVSRAKSELELRLQNLNECGKRLQKFEDFALQPQQAQAPAMPQQQYVSQQQYPMPQQQYVSQQQYPMPQQQYVSQQQYPMPQQQYAPLQPYPMPHQQYAMPEQYAPQNDPNYELLIQPSFPMQVLNGMDTIDLPAQNDSTQGSTLDEDAIRAFIDDQDYASGLSEIACRSCPNP